MVDTPVCGSSIPILKQTYASGKDGGGLAGQKSARMMTQKFLLGTQHHSKTHSRHHLSPKKVHTNMIFEVLYPSSPSSFAHGTPHSCRLFFFLLAKVSDIIANLSKLPSSWLLTCSYCWLSISLSPIILPHDILMK